MSGFLHQAPPSHQLGKGGCPFWIQLSLMAVNAITNGFFVPWYTMSRSAVHVVVHALVPEALQNAARGEVTLL